MPLLNVLKANDRINTAETEILPFFIPHILLPFQNLVPTLSTMQLDVTEGNLSDYMQFPLEPQKGSFYFLDICSRIPKTCKNKIVTL